MCIRMKLIVMIILPVVSLAEVGICNALELIISDSGRNESWSHRLRIGDDFSVKGADGRPVGGIMAGTALIQQLLIPMPSQIELKQMSQAQRNVWVRDLSALLKDRVHIATTNGVTLFEIRLLQDTPRSSNATLAWPENAYTDRFSQMSYQAIGQLVQHVQEREEKCRVTAALADSGCCAFAQAIEAWKPYADTFRRVDMVDGRSSLTETRPVISILGGKRVRLFSTEGSTTPAMSVGRTEVARELLTNHAGLTMYAIQPERVGDTDTTRAAMWQTSLAGFAECSVRRLRYSEEGIVEHQFDRNLAGQDFRDPVDGWDPLGSDSTSGDLRLKLGVVAPTLDQVALPEMSQFSNIGSVVTNISQSQNDRSSLSNIGRQDIALQKQFNLIGAIERVDKAQIDYDSASLFEKSQARQRLEEAKLKVTVAINAMSQEQLERTSMSTVGRAFDIASANQITMERYYSQARAGERTMSTQSIAASVAGGALGKSQLAGWLAAGVSSASTLNGSGYTNSALMAKDLMYKYTHPAFTKARDAYTNLIASHNSGTRTLETSRDQVNNVTSRVGSRTNLVLRGPTVLDRHDFETLKSNSVTISRDPIGIKSARPDQMVIESKLPSYKPYGSIFGSMKSYEPPSAALGRMETQKNLGEFTRGYTPKPLSMSEGFYKYEDTRLGDMTNFSRLGTSYNNFDSNRMLPRPEVDGVMLNAPAKVEGEGATITKGNVSLIFQNSTGLLDFMKLKRFATAIWCTYLSVEGPGISIEPVNKVIKNRKDKHEVRYIGQVRNTELGMVMRETDYLMKRWAVGSHDPDIDSFLTPDAIRKMINKKASRRPSRFWLVPDGITFKQSNNMLLLSSGRMTVQTEYLDRNPNGEKNEVNELFAKWLTDNYEEVSYRYPVFEQLFEYSKLVGISTYLRENQVPMLWFLMANRELIITEKSIDEVDQLNKKSGHEFWVTVHGGVEMQLDKTIQDKSRYQYDASLADAETKIRSDLSDADAKNKPVVFSANDTTYTVASENNLKLFSTSADGDTIQTDLALADEYHEKAPNGDEEDWHLVAPRLELVRYYNPKLKTRAQFGDGWHLLVPFRLETTMKTSLSGIRTAPEKVVVANLLSGIPEVLHRDKNASGMLSYVSEDKNGLTDSLVRQSNGAWILRDKLGAIFAFDRDGDLRQMILRKDQKIKFKLSEKSHSKSIPGYAVEYRYDNRQIDGRDIKVLAAVKQGSHNARIDWQTDNSRQRIAAIRVLRQGQIGPIEVLDYGYNPAGMLARVSTKNGRSISVRYEEENMRVVASRN